MTTPRNIRKVLKAKPTIEGAGVHMKRRFGFSEAPGLDSGQGPGARGSS